jgi:hypothetical protein
MNDLILDEYNLRQVSPRQLRTLLRMKGWQGSIDEPTWVKTIDGETFSVTVPIRPTIRDYALIVSELIRTLSIEQSVSQIDIWRELQSTSFDVQEICLLPNTIAGTIPIEEAATAFVAVEELVAAAATSLISPGPVLPRRPSQTNQHLKQVLAGPTREGSYILTLMTPIPPRRTTEEDQVLVEVDDLPFERAVTLRMLQALTAVRTAAETPGGLDDDTDLFVSTIDQGVSANLCEAIVQMSNGGSTGLKVDFKWALDRPIQSSENSVVIGTDLIPAIRSAASMFRLLTLRPRITVNGTVTRLHRDVQIGNGDITIAGLFTLDQITRSVKVTLNLSQSDYEDAILAHREGNTVSAEGNLVRKGTRSYLEEPSGFRIVD